MFPFPSASELYGLIDLARREDLGIGFSNDGADDGARGGENGGDGNHAAGDDVTSRLMIPESAIGVGTLLQKEVGIVCGLPIVEIVCRAFDERLKVEPIPGFHLDIIEGRFSDARSTPLLRVRGPLRSLLSAERTILNFLQHLSGVATKTHRFVRRVEGAAAKIYDTRKTIPGFRALDKYAVRCGGGMNHRAGLFDALLIKDNHIAGIAMKDLPAFLAGVVAKSRAEAPTRVVEVEVDTLDQLRQALKVDGVDVILLDNMDCPNMTAAVELRDRAGKRGKTALEASGGVTLETVRPIALTGVDRISVGAITHSAPALDIGMDVESE
jgi:nicotinate-nucleotide pyrophosphorylase (carboxylating)